jgi:hypothetical protein
MVVDHTEVCQLLVVLVARVTRHHPGAAEAAGLTHEVAFVVKTGVTVYAQAKLELVALLVAFFLGQVHEGDVLWGSSRSSGDSSREKRRTLVILESCVSVVIPRVVLELLNMLFVGGGAFILVVIPAVVVWLFGLATPFPSSGGGGRSGLGSSSRHRRHRRRHRCLCQVTTIRIKVEKVFQFFPDVSVDRSNMKKIDKPGWMWSHVTKKSTPLCYIYSPRLLPEAFLRKPNPHLRRKRLNHQANRRRVRLILANSKRTARSCNLSVNNRGFFSNSTVSHRMVFSTPSSSGNFTSSPRNFSSSILLTLQSSTTLRSSHHLRRIHFVKFVRSFVRVTILRKYKGKVFQFYRTCDKIMSIINFIGHAIKS